MTEKEGVQPKVQTIPKNMTANGYACLRDFFAWTDEGEGENVDPRLDQSMFRALPKQSQAAKPRPANRPQRASQREGPRGSNSVSEPPAPVVPVPVVVVDSDDEAQVEEPLAVPEALLAVPDAVAEPSEPVQPAAQPEPQPENVQAEAAPALEAVDVEPRVGNDGHRLVITHVLPRLKQVMESGEWCLKQPREQVRRSLFLTDRSGHRFWGSNQAFSRKRTVEDAVLQHYYDAVRRLL